jgi:hypothetical protein
MLRPKCVTIANGANVIPGLTQNYKFVQENAFPSTYWVAENSGTDVSLSTDGLTYKTLSPHQLMGMLQFTRTQLAQSPVAFDAWCSEKLVREFGIAIDVAVFGNYVSGGVLGAAAGAPSQGILLDASTNVVHVGTGGNGANLSGNIPALLNMKTSLNQNNALNGFTPVFYTTPGIQGICEQKPYPGLTYATTPVWFEDKMLGFKAVGTNNLPSAITVGTATTDCNAIILGDMRSMNIGVFGDIIVQIDPYTLMGQGLYRVIANQLADVAASRSNAFTVATDAIAS